MPPQQQQSQASQGKPPGGAIANTSSSSGGGGGTATGGGSGSSTPVNSATMNYFAALQGRDPEALQQDLVAKEDQRRTASAAGNGATAAAQQRQRQKDSDGQWAGPGLKQPLVWIDCEMTGLDVETDYILQIAVICTDGSLEQVEEGPELVIHQPEEILQGMNEWCVEQHGKSGLTQACRDSTVSLAEAEQQVLEFVQQHAPEPGTAQAAGNSVHVDLAFLRKHMPRLVDHLHYRIVDVSTLGELCRRWFPREHSRAPRKKQLHTAMSDIRESIAQLKYYRHAMFKKWSGANLP